MNFGFVVPWADADEVAELAVVAEEHGWDGIFVWEPVWGADAWISLALAAVRTGRIRVGTMLTPPSRRKPWELAGQAATVDRLSGGRLTLSVGLGAPESGMAAFGEECDRRVRAELMDECLDIVAGLWDGLIPQVIDGDGARQANLEELQAMSGDLPAGYDVIVEGVQADHSPAAWADAGATWWIESQWDAVGQARPQLATFDRLREGPPNL